jgi:Na+-transporting methylmalonyl-CoA/oxaloacetate decarboxylase gamma subunit
MRTGRFLTIFSILILALALPSAAQRKRKPAPRPTPKPTPTKPAINPVVAAAKQQVSNQLANVNLFVDKMGPIAVAIENTDKEAKTRRLKKEVVDANEANKKKLIEAIKGVRAGLVTLESDFRTKPQLSKYLIQIQGIGDLCARSEDNAIAGRFVASKDPLRQVAQKLTDTMAVLPR